MYLKSFDSLLERNRLKNKCYLKYIYICIYIYNDTEEGNKWLCMRGEVGECRCTIELIDHLFSLRKSMFRKTMGSSDNEKPHRKRHGNDFKETDARWVLRIAFSPPFFFAKETLLYMHQCDGCKSLGSRFHNFQSLRTKFRFLISRRNKQSLKPFTNNY